MNTRKHPRTLNEAFPRTAEYGAAIERPIPLRDRVGGVALAVAIGLALAVLLVEGLAK